MKYSVPKDPEEFFNYIQAKTYNFCRMNYIIMARMLAGGLIKQSRIFRDEIKNTLGFTLWIPRNERRTCSYFF